MTWLAYAVVAIPFVVVASLLLASQAGHLYLSDDLALIDFHTRRAIEWRQQLGVFDYNNWNHPGPSYFYLLSVGYRLFGSGAKAMFVTATLLNGLASIGCVEVVRRRSTPARALWSALWVCVLASVLATVAPGSVTYSEGALGAVVSPWNPMVVIFPLLLFLLLCAAAIDRSPVSLVAAAIVGSFVVQTDISTLPLVAAVIVAAGATLLVTALADRSRERPSGERARRWRRRGWSAAGLVVLILMWIPPLVEEFTNRPGNLTLIYRFFTSAHPGQTFEASVWSVVSVFGVVLVGPSEVMSSLLGVTPLHPATAIVATVGTVLVGIVTVLAGARFRCRFATAVGGVTLLGCAVMVFAVSRVVGFVFGYVVVWAVVIPVLAVIGLGTARPPRPVRRTAGRSGPALRAAAAALTVAAVAAGAVLTARLASLPPLGAVSDPRVAQLADLAVPGLGRRGTVLVRDSGAGTRETALLDIEESIGLVDLLDADGYRPTVDPVWKSEFGPGYLTTGHDGYEIHLSTWTPNTTSLPGYRGRVGDMAVVVTSVARPTG